MPEASRAPGNAEPGAAASYAFINVQNIALEGSRRESRRILVSPSMSRAVCPSKCIGIN
jgi:hypothetical protein